MVRLDKKDNISVVVAVPNKEKQQKDKGFYLQSDFIYNKENDSYTCPHQQTLTKKNGTKFYIYRASSKICKTCPLKNKRIPEKTPHKSLSHSEYENTIKSYKEKMKTDISKKTIKKRGSIVEHPFGTIKQHLGWTHFLVRGTEKVSGENALIMFSYNFRRLLNLIGIVPILKI